MLYFLELLVTDCKLDDQESISSSGTVFSLLHYAQADVGLNQPVVRGGSFLWDKATGAWIWPVMSIEYRGLAYIKFYFSISRTPGYMGISQIFIFIFIRALRDISNHVHVRKNWRSPSPQFGLYSVLISLDKGSRNLKLFISCRSWDFTPLICLVPCFRHSDNGRIILKWVWKK